MEKILETAKDLGNEIAMSSVYRRYKTASINLSENEQEMKVLKSFMELSRLARNKQSNAEDVLNDEMDNLKNLAQQVHDSEIITEYLESQSEFLGFMDEIFNELEEKI